MIINNNISALNTFRQMGINNNAAGKAMEKLSSGLRINRAGDDAAGLAISEKMRAQVRGLDQASRNSQDGISMIQTAEGALQETHNILQRMRELATQAANDTNVEVDRGEIQKEINALTSEINRIGNTTEFNTQKLLNGGEQSKTLTATATGTGAVTLTPAANEVQGVYSFEITSAFVDADTSIVIGNATFTIGDANTNSIDTTAGETDTIAKQGAKLAELINNGVDKDWLSASWDDSTNTLTLTEKAGQATGTAPTITPTVAATRTSALSTDTTSVAQADATLKIDTAFVAGDTLEVAGKTLTFGASDDYDVNVATNDDAAKQAAAIAKILAGESGIERAVAGGTDTITITQGGGAGFEANFQIGANQGQSMTISIDDMRSVALGISGTGNYAGDVTNAAFTSANTVTDGTNNATVERALDVSSHESAAAAVTVINNAIEKVSGQRSDLGAFQNRLEHTISNLNNASENLQAAESRIRDVDMAREVMEMTRANILGQASQAMLAQANQKPQSVLQLLG